MKISVLISLLLLSTLLHEVQGTRLAKGSLSKRNDQEFQEEEEDTHLTKRSKGDVNEEEVVFKDGQCSGLNRKLITTKTTPTSSPVTPIKTSSKKSKNGGNKADPKLYGKSRTKEGVDRDDEILSVKSSPVSEHWEAGSKQYSDILDVAEMDYSPARRKSPIHN